MIKLRRARTDEKRKIYEWLFKSDTTAMHSGLPDYPENPPGSWEDFLEDFEDFYFNESKKDLGGVLVIENDGEEIGSLCYACFHLKPNSAELDIWLKAKKYCGHGYGTQALKELIEYLNKDLDIKKFIIRPSLKNMQAVKAYTKAGFRAVTDKEKTIRHYHNDDYFDKYSNGDYGFEQTAVLTLEL